MLASIGSFLSELGPFGLAAVIIATIAAAGVACTLFVVLGSMYKIHLIHRERMVMIDRGMDPGPIIEDADEYKKYLEARQAEQARAEAEDAEAPQHPTHPAPARPQA